MAQYDAIVIGGGPAGLAAATWLGRYRRRTLLIDSGEHRNRWVDLSHGYLTRDPANPAELVRIANEQLKAYPLVTRLTARADTITKIGDEFVVDVEGTPYSCLRLVLAMGVVDAFPEVEGFFDHYGASVFHCPSCDGYEAQDKHVVVLGWNAYVAPFAVTLLDWAASVTIVTDGRRFPGDDSARSSLADLGVRVVEDVAERFVGTRGDLRAVALKTLGEVPCDMAFFTVAHKPRTGLAEAIGLNTTEEGCVLVNDDGETNFPGVYACGDLTPGMQLIQVAAAKGTIAGINAAQSLRGERGAASSPTPAPDPETVA